jgi:hypothetical protein
MAAVLRLENKRQQTINGGPVENRCGTLHAIGKGGPCQA